MKKAQKAKAEALARASAATRRLQRLCEAVRVRTGNPVIVEKK